jgi:hypothetical protein
MVFCRAAAGSSDTGIELYSQKKPFRVRMR